MVLKQFKTEGDWISVDYAATWKYGYDFMLDAAQVLLEDFGDNLQRFATAEIAGRELVNITDKIGKKIRECSALKDECGVIAVAGISRVMECPMQIIFYNQTNAVGLDVPLAQLPEGHPARKIFDERKDGYERSFDVYMDSLEITAYCAGAERRAIERMKRAGEPS